jgi:hypothetical protein
MPKTPSTFRVPEILLRVLFTRKLREKPCSHLREIRFKEPSVQVCEDCVELGDNWPSLRMCLICGCRLL